MIDSQATDFVTFDFRVLVFATSPSARMIITLLMNAECCQMIKVFDAIHLNGIRACIKKLQT